MKVLGTFDNGTLWIQCEMTSGGIVVGIVDGIQVAVTELGTVLGKDTGKVKTVGAKKVLGNFDAGTL